jgi:homospermidine synthase
MEDNPCLHIIQQNDMITGKDSPYLSVLLFSRKNRALLTAVTVTISEIQLLFVVGIAPLESAIIILQRGEPPCTNTMF